MKLEMLGTIQEEEPADGETVRPLMFQGSGADGQPFALLLGTVEAIIKTRFPSCHIKPVQVRITIECIE